MYSYWCISTYMLHEVLNCIMISAYV
jgi:hypothetical protein